MKKKPGKIYKVVETINLSELAGILLGCIGIYTYKNSFKKFVQRLIVSLKILLKMKVFS